MTTRVRLGKMLIGAAVIVPALIVASLMVESRWVPVHLEQRQVLQALVADAAVLGLGLLLNQGEDL